MQADGLDRHLRTHPWILRVPISRPPILPNALAWFDRALQALGDTTFAEEEKVSVVLCLVGFVRNESSIVADIAAGMLSEGSSAPVVMAHYGRLLAALIDEVRFPALSAAVAAGVFDGPENPDYDFVFGLDRILDGVAALIAAKSA